ncbi:MAG: hypothetical protein ACOYBX_08805 [Mycobacterium sp.]
MIAGTTAIVGAAAIAMTPIAPAASLPSLSVSKAAVSLAAWANPIQALADSINVGVDYLINSDVVYDQTGGGEANWGGESGISDYTNSVLPYGYWDATTGPFLPYITNVGLIPNLVNAPLPIATQVVTNLIGYANVAWQAGGAAVGYLSTALWAPVGLTAAIITDILTGNFADIPVQIQDTISGVISDVTNAFSAAVGGVTNIVQNVVAKAQAAIQVLVSTIPAALAVIPAQLNVLGTTAQGVFGNVTTALSTGDIQGAWNAAVAGLLSPGGVGNYTIPGDLLNLTLGAGVQLDDVTDQATYYANVVPSVRNVVQSLGQGLSIALSTTAPVAAASVRSAAAKTVKAAPAAAVAATDSAAADSTAAAAPAKKAPAKVGRHAAAAKAAAAK